MIHNAARRICIISSQRSCQCVGISSRLIDISVRLTTTMWLCKQLVWFLVVGFRVVQCDNNETIFLELHEPSTDEVSMLRKQLFLVHK